MRIEKIGIKIDMTDSMSELIEKKFSFLYKIKGIKRNPILKVEKACENSLKLSLQLSMKDVEVIDVECKDFYKGIDKLHLKTKTFVMKKVKRAHDYHKHTYVSNECDSYENEEEINFYEQ